MSEVIIRVLNAQRHPLQRHHRNSIIYYEIKRVRTTLYPTSHRGKYHYNKAS